MSGYQMPSARLAPADNSRPGRGQALAMRIVLRLSIIFLMMIGAVASSGPRFERAASEKEEVVWPLPCRASIDSSYWGIEMERRKMNVLEPEIDDRRRLLQFIVEPEHPEVEWSLTLVQAPGKPPECEAISVIAEKNIGEANWYRKKYTAGFRRKEAKVRAEQYRYRISCDQAKALGSVWFRVIESARVERPPKSTDGTRTVYVYPIHRTEYTFRHFDSNWPRHTCARAFWLGQAGFLRQTVALAESMKDASVQDDASREEFLSALDDSIARIAEELDTALRNDDGDCQAGQ